MSTAAERLAAAVTDGEQSSDPTVRLLGAILVQLIELREDLKRREARHLADRDASRGNGATRSAPAPSSSGGAVFPNYGRAKNQPIAGASTQDLDYYANGARKSIADPAKAQWRSKEEALLAEIEREIARQSGGGQTPGNDAPPDFGGGGDDDIPF